jgi:hypothetical protein
MSFSGAEAVAAQYPQYAEAITAGAKQSFLDGADWAYAAGIGMILIGAVLVFFMFPRKEREHELLAEYHAEDARQPAPAVAPPGPAVPEAAS